MDSINNFYLNLLRFVFAISDAIMINMCLILCSSVASKYFISVSVTGFQDLLACTLIWMLSTSLFNLYHQHTITKRKRIYRATWRSVATFIILFQLYLLVSSASYFLPLVISFYCLIIVSFLISRWAYRTFERQLTRKFKTKRVNVLAIASIGGHWVQLLRLMPLFKNTDVTFISTKGTMENTVSGYKYYSVPDANRNNKLNLIWCCLSVGQVIFFSRPEIIITTGAAPGLVGIFIGKLLGIKTIWIDSIANVDKLSLSGTIALKVADRVYTQWEHLSTPEVVFAGNVLES